MKLVVFGTKTKLVVSIIIILMFVLGLSYGTFLIGTDNYKVSELLIAELNYGITITKDDTSTCTINGTMVTTSPSTECFITIEISSVNPIDSRYALAYTNKQGNAIVEYTDKTQWKSEGVIDGYTTEDTTYTRKVRVVINNTGQNTETITDFKVFGGYKFNSEVSIDLNNGYQTIPGTYTESIEAGNKRLIDIIEKDTNCLTSDSKECLYGGGVITNYLQYPTSSNASDNLWRITGSYDLDGTTYAKVVYNTNQATTALTNIKNTLDSFYSTLDKASDVIFNTDKFNCTKRGCTTSTYSKIGLLSVYEYEQAGGYESYLGNTNNWFALQDTIIKNITPNNIEEATGNSGIRPTAYLQTDVMVTGKGTLEDPYRISPKGDINFVAYTFENKPTSATFQELLNSKVITKITCENGTKATWDKATKSINLTDIQVPDYCTINFENKLLLFNKILADNPNIGVREDFSKIFDQLQIEAGLYKETESKYLEEDGKTKDAVYYYVGNVNNNWVKFGKEGDADIWWRIIRTNENGSIRLLYAGKSPDTTTAYIGKSAYAAYASNTMYSGYMYGSTGSLSNNRRNLNSSTIKNTIDNWYKNNINDKTYEGFKLGDFVSKTAIYCNDRSTSNYSATGYVYYGTYNRLEQRKHPSYKCGYNPDGTEENNWLYTGTGDEGTPGGADKADRFTAKNSSGIGNENLQYPVALITADDLVFAGGLVDGGSPNVYFVKNSVNGEASNSMWWILTPAMYYGASGGLARGYRVNADGVLSEGYAMNSKTLAARPVLSLKSCVQVDGKGTTDDPYIPSIDAECAAADN